MEDVRLYFTDKGLFVTDGQNRILNNGKGFLVDGRTYKAGADIFQPGDVVVDKTAVFLSVPNLGNSETVIIEDVRVCPRDAYERVADEYALRLSVFHAKLTATRISANDAVGKATAKLKPAVQTEEAMRSYHNNLRFLKSLADADVERVKIERPSLESMVRLSL